MNSAKVDKPVASTASPTKFHIQTSPKKPQRSSSISDSSVATNSASSSHSFSVENPICPLIDSRVLADFHMVKIIILIFKMHIS